MGRPINYKKIGGNTSSAGQQLRLTAWFENSMGAEPAFVVKQTASRSFLLAAVADPNKRGVFRLGNTLVQGETAILEVMPFGLTEPNGFAIATVTLTTGGATLVPDGEYTLNYVSGSPAPAEEFETDMPLITFLVESGVFTEIVEIVEPGRFLTTPAGSVLTFSSVALSIQTNPTVTVNTATQLFAPVVENARKLTQHRVVTFDGNAYKYKVGVAADQAGEADLETA